MPYLPALFGPVLVAALAVLVNIPQALGAHPWWSQTVILIGVPIGLLLAAGLSRLPVSPRVMGAVSAGSALLALAIAAIGKARFAASYAEDTLAGHMWYFGWIATCALAAACIALFLWPKRPTH